MSMSLLSLLIKRFIVHLLLYICVGGSETSYCRHLVLQGEKLGYRSAFKVLLITARNFLIKDMIINLLMTIFSSFLFASERSKVQDWTLHQMSGYSFFLITEGLKKNNCKQSK